MRALGCVPAVISHLAPSRKAQLPAKRSKQSALNQTRLFGYERQPGMGYSVHVSDRDVVESAEKKDGRRSVAEALRPIAFFKCLFVRGGHDYVNSKARPGHLTCVRCRYRRKNRM